MKNRIGLVFFFLLALGFIASCESTREKKATDTAPSSLNATMIQLGQRLTEFFPILYSKSQYRAPENEKLITKEITALLSAAHSINQQEGVTKKDPGMMFVAGRLDGELNAALESFKNGQKDYSQRMVQSVVRNCFYCHSQSGMGPQWQVNFNSFGSMPNLLKSEQSDLYVATRQFDKALEVLKQAAMEKEYYMNYPFEREKAIRKFLALSIRVKQDPKIALELLNSVLEEEVKPNYLEDQVTSWKDSLVQWVREEKAKKPTPQNPVKQAEKLIRQAQTVQDFPVDNSGDVYYLRASALLHNFLQQNPKGPETVQALYLLGVSYEVLSDIGPWDLADFYYEVCIRQSPHSEIAMKCYRRWEQAIYAGYSGSGGVFIPPVVRTRMKDLRELAQPVK